MLCSCLFGSVLPMHAVRRKYAGPHPAASPDSLGCVLEVRPRELRAPRAIHAISTRRPAHSVTFRQHLEMQTHLPAMQLASVSEAFVVSILVSIASSAVPTFSATRLGTRRLCDILHQSHRGESPKNRPSRQQPASFVGQIKKVTRPLTASLCEGATTAKLSIRAPLLFPEVLLVGTAR